MVTTDDIKSMIDLLLDDWSDSRGGSTRADRLSSAIEKGENDRATYEAICTSLFPEIACRDWSFWCKFDTFAVNAKFSKEFFASLAAYVKTSMDEARYGDQGFLRGAIILMLCRRHPELFDYEWIVESSPQFVQHHSWHFHTIKVIYHPDSGLREFESLLKTEVDPKKRFNYLSTRLLIFPKITGKGKVLPYVGAWIATLAQADQEKFRTVLEEQVHL